MKFFIAAPWRNKAIVEGLGGELTKRGYDIYSFLQSGANLLTGGSVVDELRTFSDAMQNWHENPDIKRIFESELAGIKECDVLILLEPAGHSSLIESGIAYGLGKKVIVVGTVEKPEVFYRICETIYPDIPAFLDDLSRIAPK